MRVISKDEAKRKFPFGTPADHEQLTKQKELEMSTQSTTASKVNRVLDAAMKAGLTVDQQPQELAGHRAGMLKQLRDLYDSGAGRDELFEAAAAIADIGDKLKSKADQLEQLYMQEAVQVTADEDAHCAADILRLAIELSKNPNVHIKQKVMRDKLDQIIKRHASLIQKNGEPKDG